MNVAVQILSANCLHNKSLSSHPDRSFVRGSGLFCSCYFHHQCEFMRGVKEYACRASNCLCLLAQKAACDAGRVETALPAARANANVINN